MSPLHRSLLLALSFNAASTLASPSPSPKRGLLYVTSSTSTRDTQQFLNASTDLTWYYNYASSPTSAISSSAASRERELEFVPMLWGLTGADDFVADVEALRNAGTNVTAVLAFNEPDQTSAVGGSDIAPDLAAQVWLRAVQPLKRAGVRLGAPAVSGGPDGLAWLKSFMSSCSACTVDFLPLHWYGSFEGLAAHIGEVNAAFPSRPVWLTELGWNNQSLGVTTDFFNQTLTYLDRLRAVERYSWFGAFRSDRSNVGPNVAFLNADGALTDLGAEYLGMPKTGVQPTESAARRMGGRRCGEVAVFAAAAAAAVVLGLGLG